MLYSDKKLKYAALESKHGFAPKPSSKSTPWVSIVLLMLIGSYIGYKMGYSKGKENPIVNVETLHLKEPLEQLQSENLRLKEALSIAERNHQIELEAKRNLAEFLKSSQKHNTELSQNVAVYQTVTNKALVEHKVQIKAFYLFASHSPDTFRYSVMLSKSFGTDYIQGVVTMMIKGIIEEKPITLTVKYLDSNRNDGLAYKFRHFQELTGELSLPESFVPQEVSIKIIPDKGGVPTFQQFPWIVSD